MEVTLGYRADSMRDTDHVKIVTAGRMYIIRPLPEGGDGLEDGGLRIIADKPTQITYVGGDLHLTTDAKRIVGPDWDDPKYHSPGPKQLFTTEAG